MTPGDIRASQAPRGIVNSSGQLSSAVISRLTNLYAPMALSTNLAERTTVMAWEGLFNRRP